MLDDMAKFDVDLDEADTLDSDEGHIVHPPTIANKLLCCLTTQQVIDLQA
jgi:hypothetical protein